MKTVILMILNGEQLSKLLMTVIRFCLTIEDHRLKKVLSLYWEVVAKYDAAGKLLPEMILVCNALRNDLNHPNEYVRGCTLRFLCKVKEAEVIEPLVPSVKANLEHRHSYVRRNAVAALSHLHETWGDEFVPEAAELIGNFLVNEVDSGARRNAFLMLYQVSQERAVEYLVDNLDQIGKFGDGFQLVILELTRKVCRSDPTQKSRFIKVIFQLLNSESAAVSYEAAWTLVSLSSAPTAIRAAASCYTHLLTAQSDNNVKLIVLDRLSDLKKHHAKVLQELLLDIMRVLSSPNSDIRRKTLDIAMDLITPRNIDEAVLVLKKEVVKTQSKEQDKSGEYQQMLIKAIHSCAIKYPAVANSVVHILMDFLNGDGATGVILFVREMVETYATLRESIMLKLVECLPDIKSARVYRAAVWILGEYSDSEAMIDQSKAAIDAILGPMPFLAPPEEPSGGGGGEAPSDDQTAEARTQTSRPVVLADGTYATQSAVTEGARTIVQAEESPPVVRTLLCGGDFFLGAAIASALTKLVLRRMALAPTGASDPVVKAQVLDVMLKCCAMITLGKSGVGAYARAASASEAAAAAMQGGAASYGKNPPHKMDKDSYERIVLCLRVLADPPVTSTCTDVLLHDSRSVFSTMLQERRELANDDDADSTPHSHADDVISFRQLRARRALGAAELDLDDEADLNKATGLGIQARDFAARLKHVYQLTGFADPVYAEAYVTVHDYDIMLDILLINRTPNTLTNLAVELSTMGDLKLVERPQNFTIGPLDFRNIRANIKVSSTETGHIFGNIVYDSPTSVQKTVVNLNDIHIDIMDYIRPATCSDAQFRTMWAEFEWENKVAVNTTVDDLGVFLDHIVASTNMNCLTPNTSLGGTCSFLAANLYAKSIFGEDALVNVSVEKNDAGKIMGYIRIRSKTQGIALSLGDRITMKQKSL